MTDMKMILDVLRAAEVDQATYVDILYRKGARMVVSYLSAQNRLERTRMLIAQLETEAAQ